MDKFKKYIIDSEQEKNHNNMCDVSVFWKKQYNSMKLNLQFIPNEEEIKNLRTWKKRTAMGNGNPNEQLKWANKSYKRLLQAFPNIENVKKFSNNLIESNFGNPVKLETDIGNFSGMFYLNIIQSYCIYNSIKNNYLDNKLDKELDICEIGTGWGQLCEILNQQLSISSYTSIDLKETLVLSYLNAVHNFDSSDIQLICDTDIKKYNFCIPENINHLEENSKQYDIFINCYSFQEMSKENVIGYVEFIKKKLKKNGLFISINSWGYDRYEIKNFTDLQLHNFKIIDIYKDPRSIGCIQLVTVCKNTSQVKPVDLNKLNNLANDLKNNKITTEDFFSIYNE